jgi:hypothetical protein
MEFDHVWWFESIFVKQTIDFGYFHTIGGHIV